MTQYNVKELIPHRDPLLLVDEIVDAEAYKFIKTTKHVKEDEAVFAGHFPGHPVWPGVYAIEAVAQTGACLVNLSLGKKAKDTIFYFMSVDSAKFRAPISPNDQLDIKVTQEKMRGTIFKFKGELTVKGQVMAQVAFTAKVEDI